MDLTQDLAAGPSNNSEHQPLVQDTHQPSCSLPAPTTTLAVSGPSYSIKRPSESISSSACEPGAGIIPAPAKKRRTDEGHAETPEIESKFHAPTPVVSQASGKMKATTGAKTTGTTAFAIPAKCLNTNLQSELKMKEWTGARSRSVASLGKIVDEIYVK